MRSRAVRNRTLVYAKARYSEVGRKRGKVRRPEQERVTRDGAVPAIVDEGLWDAAQAKHGARRFGSGRPWHRPYLLSGLISCGHCGKRFQGHRQVRGTVAAYYVCGGYIAAGPSVCDGCSIPIGYLDDAVIDGIQKRLDLALDRERLRLSLVEWFTAERAAGPDTDILEEQLGETRRRISRLVEALASGVGDLPSVRGALVGLERDRERLEAEVARATARATRAPEMIETIVGQLLDALGRFREVLDTGEPEERKAVVRAFLQGVTVEKATGRAILRWYRPPRLGESLKLVELRGFEPLTPRLPALCSPN